MSSLRSFVCVRVCCQSGAQPVSSQSICCPGARLVELSGAAAIHNAKKSCYMYVQGQEKKKRRLIIKQAMCVCTRRCIYEVYLRLQQSSVSPSRSCCSCCHVQSSSIVANLSQLPQVCAYVFSWQWLQYVCMPSLGTGFFIKQIPQVTSSNIHAHKQTTCNILLMVIHCSI